MAATLPNRGGAEIRDEHDILQATLDIVRPYELRRHELCSRGKSATSVQLSERECDREISKHVGSNGTNRQSLSAMVDTSPATIVTQNLSSQYHYHE